MTAKKYIYLAISLLIMNGCGGDKEYIDKNITISQTPTVETLGKYQHIHAAINIGNTPKTLYLIMTNDSNIQTHNSVQKNFKLSKQNSSKQYNKSLPQTNGIIRTPDYVKEFEKQVAEILHKKSQNNLKSLNKITIQQNQSSVGDSKLFYIDDTSSGATTTATLKKQVAVSTSFGNKTLEVWVSDDAFAGSGCTKSNCVDQTMVDNLADKFLKSGSDNDIYDWDTNIYGQEWGADAQTKESKLIGADNHITILLTDINNDNRADGGVIGYFYAKDNFKASEISGSNQRIMFYIDSVMYANPDHSRHDWQKETYSTLAHEFQHMIHFYQKSILLANGNMTDTWINEMISETTEDLVSTKIDNVGPRGIDPSDGSAGAAGNKKGRYTYFNILPYISLTQWNNSLYNYSHVSSFGAFLVRNYGGAKLLHDIMHNPLLHEDAVMDAIHKTAQGEGKTFGDILREWAIAVALSDIERPVMQAKTDLPSYNSGDFTYDTYGNSTYKLGSINFFNYDPSLKFSNCNTVYANSNCYYKIGNNLTGNITIDIDLDKNTTATLIAK